MAASGRVKGKIRYGSIAAARRRTPHGLHHPVDMRRGWTPVGHAEYEFRRGGKVVGAVLNQASLGNSWHKQSWIGWANDKVVTKYRRSSNAAMITVEKALKPEK